MIFDLSRAISPGGHGMSLFPGTAPPEAVAVATLARDGFLEQRISLSTHTGTHLDAPSHLFPQGPTVTDLAPDRFLGPALLLDLRGKGPAIGQADLAPFLPRLADREFALLFTGWGGRWGSGAYFSGWPSLTADAARVLAMFPLKGVGVDALSVDSAGSRDLPVHRILLGAGMVVVENLARLEALPHPEFTFSCLPLPLEGAEGSPVRALAIT